jgi:shikimate dehydrogenase
MSGARILFVGLSTAGSLIHRVFPAWMEELGLEVRIQGRDIPAGADAQVYHSLVTEIGARDDLLGAVVTAHKLPLFAAARELVEPADPYVELLGEINVIAKSRGALVARALDPVAIGRVLPTLLAGRTPEEVLCLGAGGAGTAVTASLVLDQTADGLVPRLAAFPQRVIVSDTGSARLTALREVLALASETGVELELLEVDSAEGNSARLRSLAAGSLVVNATGLGKESDASPIADRTPFPSAAIAWDLNYRGPLPFLRAARSQAPAAGLLVEDGWRYFVESWSLALEQILGLQGEADLVARLATVADRVRARP